MKCLFCGSDGKMSREHLWPRWARETLDLDEQRDLIAHSIEKQGLIEEEWNAPVFSATLKRVCLSCNNGWMSSLEQRAQPIAAPLLLGQRRALSEEDQRALALWAYLKCLLLVTVGGEPMAEAMSEACKTFYVIKEGELLPLHTSAFSARHVGPRQGQYQYRLLGKPHRPALFIQTFTVRQLTIQIVNNYMERGPIEPERDSSLEGKEARIWPPSPTAIEWPPGAGLDDNDLTVYTGPQPAQNSSQTRAAPSRRRKQRKSPTKSERRVKGRASRRARRRSRRR